MNKKQLTNVIKRYKKAWETQDTNLILNCFTKNGIYQESPLTKSYKGHREIKEFWNKEVVGNTKEIKFTIKGLYLSEDKKIGFVEWGCVNIYKGKRNKMVGIFIIKMSGDKISYLNEYWNSRVLR